MRTIFATTAGLPPTDTMIRTKSGREVRSGDIVTSDDPIVLAPRDGTSTTIKIGFVEPELSRRVRLASLRGRRPAHSDPIEQERLATWDRVLP